MPDWFTVNTLSPTVIFPLREDVPVLAETEYVTLPLPLPSVADVILIHEVRSAAVHLHPAGAVTLKLPLPLPAPKDCEAGLKL